MQGWKDEGLWLLVTVEQIAQVAQAPLAFDGPIEGFHHQAIAGLIERELYAQLLSILQFDDGETIGNGYHHAVAVNVADGACLAEVVDSGFPAIHPEKRYWSAELEVMFDVGICRAHYLHSQLVQRVVIALADLYWPPGITSLNLSRYTRLLGLLAKGLFLCFVF